jgi:glutaredoxin 3
VKPVKIYTKSYCPYCVKAKRLFEQKKIPFEEVDIENDPEFAQKLFAQTGFRTVPQIFIGSECIGGCDDLYALEKEKKLDNLLAD